MSVVWIAIEPEDAVVHAYLLWVRIKHGWRAWLDLDFVDGHPKLLPFFLRRDAQTENKRHLLKIERDSITSNLICKKNQRGLA